MLNLNVYVLLHGLIHFDLWQCHLIATSLKIMKGLEGHIYYLVDDSNLCIQLYLVDPFTI